MVHLLAFHFSMNFTIESHISFSYESSDNDMLWTTSVILFVFWFLEILMSYTFGGYIHIFRLVRRIHG
jgi:hypothetical protein